MSARTYIIAEAGVNHNGSEDLALRLIDIAADAKADAVKFQLFSPEALTTSDAKTAEYQATNLSDTAISQRTMLEALTLPDASYLRLEEHCRARGIDFLCTPFDHGSLRFLTTHTQMPSLKLASGELTNGPFLYDAAQCGLPILLSTGMGDIEEVGVALAILHAGFYGTSPVIAQPSAEMLAQLSGKVMLLHCVSQYPAPPESSNLKALDTLTSCFGLPVGLSDHTLGIHIALAAVARGARIIEKHFTYDVNAKGPDHAASLTPEALADMVRQIHDIESAMGDGIKQCQPQERNTRNVARKSLVAARAIRRGEAFSHENLCCKRPADKEGSLPPNYFWQLLGKPAKSDYSSDAHIQADELNA